MPLTLVAGLAHAATGTVNWTVLGLLLLGSIPGIVIGSWAAPRVDERVLRSLLAAVLTVVGSRFAFVKRQLDVKAPFTTFGQPPPDT